MTHLCSIITPLTGCRFTLIHLDHRLRPESSAEGEVVSALADRLELRCLRETLPLPEVLAQQGGNMEATARELRYERLARVAREQSCTAVFTGHIAEDLAETLWLWLLRGTGLRGLSPLKSARPILPGNPVTLYRPLLDFRREELRAHLKETGITWCEDPSNNEVTLRRNRVRHRLMPWLRSEFGFDPTPAAARLARQTGEIADYLDSELVSRGFPPSTGKFTSLDLAAFRKLPPVLGRWLLAREMGRLGESSEDSVRELYRHCREGATGKCLDLPAGLRARFTDRELRFESGNVTNSGSHPTLNPAGSSQVLPASGELPLGAGWRLRIGCSDPPGARPVDPSSAQFDYDRLTLPLRLTSIRPGQRIRPLGGPGSRKLSDLFIDCKVPRGARGTYPLLLDGDDQVLWVPGLVRGDQAPVTESTKQCLCLDLERRSS
ncbi:MAG: tRNA lysidine(34) synthetase TilS [bacterium]|nr:tRNA lysidine(34) synthetase TilS [bacterium]